MRHLLKLFLVMILLSMFAFSQPTTSGDITGVITDPSGAVVPNAKVTATNDATRESHTVTTNGEGVYRFSFLKPGSYTVTALAQGFQNTSRKVQVGIGQASTAN